MSICVAHTTCKELNIIIAGTQGDQDSYANWSVGVGPKFIKPDLQCNEKVSILIPSSFPLPHPSFPPPSLFSTLPSPPSFDLLVHVVLYQQMYLSTHMMLHDHEEGWLV